MPKYDYLEVTSGIEMGRWLAGERNMSTSIDEFLHQKPIETEAQKAAKRALKEAATNAAARLAQISVGDVIIAGEPRRPTLVLSKTTTGVSVCSASHKMFVVTVTGDTAVYDLEDDPENFYKDYVRLRAIYLDHLIPLPVALGRFPVQAAA